MSASREKRNRKTGEDLFAAKNTQPAKKSNAGKVVVSIVCVVLAVCLIAASLLLTSSWPQKTFTAVTVGDTYELTAADFGYFYRQAYSSMYASMGENADSMIGYFAESIMEQAQDSVQQTYAAYDAALKEGYAMTEQELTDLNEEIDSLESTSTMLGFKNADEYLGYVYGKGATPENYRKYVEVTTLAGRYLTDKMEAYEPTAEEKAAYYAEHTDDVDMLNYRQYLISVNDEMTLDAAKAAAEKMVADAKADEASFDKNAYELAPESKKAMYEDADGTLLSNVKPALMTEDMGVPAFVKEWLNAAERKAGDATYLVNEEGTAVYVLYFISRDTQDYASRNALTLFVAADTTAEDTAKAEEAKAAAQAYLDQYLAGEKTEEAFEALVTEDTEDATIEHNHNVGKTDLPKAIIEWLYAAQNKGEAGLVETAEGYYVVCYEGEGENYRDTVVSAAMDEAFYNATVEELTAAYPLTENSKGMQYVATASAY